MPPKSRPKTKSRPVRGAPRSNPNQLVSSFAPERLRPPQDPPIVQNTVRVSKKIQLFIPAESTPTVTPISASLLATAVPGGLTYWSTMRIERIDAWGSGLDDSTIQLMIVSQPGWSQPNLQLEDVGTPGQQRPRIGVRLGLLDRARWFSTADTTVLCSLQTSSSTATIVLQATIELLSPPLT